MKNQYECQISEGFRYSGSKSIFYDFSVDLIWFCIFYPVCVMVLDIGVKTPFAFAAPVILLIGMLLTTLNRKKTKRLPVFILLQLLIAVVVSAAGPDLGGRVLFFIIIGILSICSMAKYHSLLNIKDAGPDEISQEASLSDFHIGIGELCLGTAVLYLSFLIALGYREPIISILCLAAFCCVITIYWLYEHNADSSALLHNSISNDSSLAEYKHLNRLIIGGAIFIIVILACLSYFFYVFTGLVHIDDSIVALFLGLNNLKISKNSTEFPGQNTQPTAKPQIAIPKDTMMNATIVFVLKCFIYVFVAVLLLIVSLLLLLFLFRLARKILHVFKMQKGEEVHQSVFSFKEIAEKMKVRVKSHTVFTAISGKANNVKVRKTYHKFVRRQIKSGAQIKKNDAPFDIKQKVKTNYDLRDTTEIYEKARYSDSECTDDEVATMKGSTGK